MRRFLALLLIGAPAFAGPLPQADAVFAEPDMDQVRLGWQLFYDPILSGNRTVACATCHHPRFATGDGLSLGLGDGGIGIGPARRADPDNPPEQLIPRNAPALFNLGASEFDTMFHDGRLEADPSQPGGIRTPLGQEMVAGFSGVLSAQSMFPVLSPDEMAGHYNENEISRAVRMGRLTGEGGAWDLLSARIEAIPAYRAGFDAVIGAGQPIGFTDISDAIAAFIAYEWRADDSPFDRFLRGGPALPEPAARGMDAVLWKRALRCLPCGAVPDRSRFPRACRYRRSARARRRASKPITATRGGCGSPAILPMRMRFARPPCAMWCAPRLMAIPGPMRRSKG
jgi:cytochrome c peroxidase